MCVLLKFSWLNCLTCLSRLTGECVWCIYILVLHVGEWMSCKNQTKWFWSLISTKSSSSKLNAHSRPQPMMWPSHSHGRSISGEGLWSYLPLPPVRPASILPIHFLCFPYRWQRPFHPLREVNSLTDGIISFQPLPQYKNSEWTGPSLIRLRFDWNAIASCPEEPLRWLGCTLWH